ncbi:MAG: DUF3427 domain-containing protein [Spirochaetales bacterium]|nr:DUF3427 domain-containing protein [Spirochaetales bacterium]
MKLGLYDVLVNLLTQREIDDSSLQSLSSDLDSADSHDYLGQYIHNLFVQSLAQIRADKSTGSDAEAKKSKIRNQISICNEIISIFEKHGIRDLEELYLPPDTHKLLALYKQNVPKSELSERPDTPLNLGALLTGTRQDPSLVSQLKKEIVNADGVDILCSFIKWSGIRILEPALRTLTEVNGNRFRIITTSYMGATDQKAVEFLSTLPNTEIKISYDSHRTRLHAKAYLFRRETGFSTAYVGSSNISNAALTEGLEWNIKISQWEQQFQWNKIEATFETYWNDSEFVSYSESERERLKSALQSERVGFQDNGESIALFDLKPYSFQEEILDKIFTERSLLNRKKHLVIAATGTGKTIVAAFAYKRWLREEKEEEAGQYPPFLFIAHREEILKQSLATFRAVLRDHNFGDLLVGNHAPSQMENLFVSIQSFNSKSLYDRYASDYFKFIIVDEFHHAAAKSYQKLLSKFAPDFLLGLTATPERTDGGNILKYFDDHISSEIRLPDAINRKLLCPFQYFGISDSVDYSVLKWERGGYRSSDLDNVLTGNDIRASLIIDKTIETVLSVKKTRGLGFCVSKKHAESMANSFNTVGIPSAFLTSDSSPELRNRIKGKLQNREINFLFVVDLFNEGVDIPQIDTVLFLRPTESLTIFLQQLGRGLRLDDEKDCLTVLDFVGQCHKNFRFDLRFRALINNSQLKIDDEVNNEFPHLPAGCTIQLERQAQKYILDNIKQSFIQRKSKIIQNIAEFSRTTGLKLSLETFLTYHHLEIDTIYKSASWTRLKTEAGVHAEFHDPEEEILSKGLRRLCTINDEYQIKFIRSWLYSDREAEDEVEKQRLTMFLFTLFRKSNIPADFSSAREILNRNPVLKVEIGTLINYRENAIESTPPVQTFNFICSLSLHCSYTRDALLSGLGYWNLTKQKEMREGVLQIKDINTDVFLITLNKTEKHYSPTTMYEDYAMDDRYFHWQSQSTTAETSPTGQRYIHHKKNNHSILMFVREDQKRNGIVLPYYFLGKAEYISHTGSKPMSITWKLESPMPAHLVRQTNRMVVG